MSGMVFNQACVLIITLCAGLLIGIAIGVRASGERKPKFSHPCAVCNARGYVAPHRGQHAVSPAPSSRISPGPPPPPPPGQR